MVLCQKYQILFENNSGWGIVTPNVVCIRIYIIQYNTICTHTHVCLYHTIIIFFCRFRRRHCRRRHQKRNRRTLFRTHEWAPQHTLTRQYTIYIGTGEYASNRPWTPSHRRHRRRRHASWLARDQWDHDVTAAWVWGAKPSPPPERDVLRSHHRDECENERDSRGPRAHCAETELVARAVGPSEIVVVVGGGGGSGGGGGEIIKL